MNTIIDTFLITCMFAGGVFTISAQNVVDTLPELEVAASKASRELSSTVPYHFIGEEDVKLSGITDIGDALRRLPGVNVRDYGGAGGLKTVSVRGLGAQHTGVTYDGIPLSDMRSGQIDLSRYSLDNVSAISVTSGDNSDIFMPARAAASAATVALVSSKPIPSDGPESFGFSSLAARLRVGSFCMINPSLKMTFSKANKMALGISGEYNHGKNDYPFTLENGVATERLRRTNSLMNSGHGEVNFAWKPFSGSTLTAKLYYYDNNRQLPGPVMYYVDDTHERLHDRDMSGQLSMKSRLSSKFSLLVMAKHTRSSSFYSDLGGQYTGGRLEQRYRQRETYASGSLLWLPLHALSADYSIDWFYNCLRSNLASNRKPGRHSLLQTIAVKYNVWLLTVTGRVLHSWFRSTADDMSPRHDSRFSPSVSLSLQPLEDVNFFIRAGYKDIFRMPTFNELYFDNYGSLNLEPEYTKQWNIGFTYGMTRKEGFLSHLDVTVDGYHNRVDNKIVAIPYSLFRYTMKNLGRVRIFGVDATLSAGFRVAHRHEIVATGNWTYQRAAPRTSRDMLDWNRQLAYTPLNSGGGSLTWLNPWVNLVFHVTGASARYTTNENYPTTRLAPYADCGVSVFRDFKIKGNKLELRADMLNMFDKQYEVVALYPMPGRSFQFTIGFEI